MKLDQDLLPSNTHIFPAATDSMTKIRNILFKSLILKFLNYSPKPLIANGVGVQIGTQLTV